MSQTSLQKLTTAKEYIDFYYDKIKKELNIRGLQISKVGLVGYILHILGFTQQDIKQYYDTLFREAFLGTSDLDENLNMHGTIWGYKTALSHPASIVGSFEINLDSLPKLRSGIQRVINLENVRLVINNLYYKLESKYVITGGNNCQITDTSGKVTNVPLSIDNPVVSIIDMKQYVEEEYEFSTPYYIFGSYYNISIEPNVEGSVCEIVVSIKEADKEDFEEYEVRLVDYYSTAQEKVVFVKYENTGKILLQIGSGIHGYYAPNSTVNVKLKITSGTAGNVSKQSVTPQEGNIRVTDIDVSTGQLVYSTTYQIGQLLTANIDYAEGGQDLLSGEDLRLDIIGFIRSRNNMMSEYDFYYILKKYIPDFILMFKKSHVVDNIIYLFLPFRDQYQLPIRSQSISVKHPEFNPSSNCFVYKPQFILNGKTYISPFLYVVDFMLRVYKGYLAYDERSTYFSSVVDHISSDVTYKGPARETLPLSLYVTYDQTTDSTRFLLQSYEDITNYVFFMTIPQLGIYELCLNQYDDSSFEYLYINSDSGSGLIYDAFDISIDVYNASTKEFTYSLENFWMTSDISDLLTLKTFEGEVSDDDRIYSASATSNISHMFPPSSWIINIPVMLLDEFSENKDYYLTKFLNTFSLLSIEHQRMISDEIQIRFINTDFVDANILSKTTKQSIALDIYFPLLLKINILGYKEKLIKSELNISEERNKLKLQLAQILNDKYTGTKVSFYKTQIIDIIHNLDWVKSCAVNIWDSNYTEIPEDFELLSQRDAIPKMTKLEAIKFCPLYPWWDVDNIEIEMIFE